MEWNKEHRSEQDKIYVLKNKKEHISTKKPAPQFIKKELYEVLKILFLLT